MSSQIRLTKSEIFTVYNTLRAFARRNPDIIDPTRVNKALGILQSKAYYQGEKVVYQPSPDSCGCKDWEYRYANRRKYTGACKHMLAELLIVKIMELRKAHDVTRLVSRRSEIMRELGF